MGFFATALVVRDTDGSAFVTKAEFDALKNSFQRQVDNYNTSIDAKIDGAIAAYLASVRMETAVAGENYLKKMNNTRKVTFWSPSATTINASTTDKIRRNYMWKYFGAFYSPYMRAAFNWKDASGNAMNYDDVSKPSYYNGWTSTWATTYTYSKPIEGSFLLDLFSYGHSREFEFQTVGSATNYFYQVANKTIGSDNYIVLDGNKSYSIKQVCGGYYVIGDLVARSWNGISIPTSYNFNHRDEVLDYTTNSFEPSSISVNLGLSNYTNALPGATFNVWIKNANAVDSNFLYDFTNTSYGTTTTLNTFTNESFLDWTKDYTYTGTKRVAGDWWFSFVGPGGTYKRAYTWQGWDYQSTANMDPGTIDNTYGTMKVKQPDFKSYASSKIINGLASDQIGKPVYPYSGAPLTAIPQSAKSMKAVLDVKIYDATETLKSGIGYDVVLSSEPFTNVSTDTIITTGETDKVKIFTNSIGNADMTITLSESFFVNKAKDTILYIRVVPKTDKNNYHIYVNCDEVTFTTEM